MLLVGDWHPGDKKVVFNPEATYVLGNLEGPVLPLDHTFTALKKAGPSQFSTELPKTPHRFLFSLANNHTMDYGLPGLEVTLKLLEQAGAKVCGAGRDLHEAREPIIIEEKGVRVGVVACCEAQFGVAGRDSAGVAEFGHWIYRTIRQLCEKVDAVVVSAHAAIEDSPWPSPFIREMYHSFIDAGASIVHGHHAHVPQGYEVYGDGVIFYGMGNFAVDPDKWANSPNGMWSLAAEIDFATSPVSWRPLTFEIRHQNDSDTILVEESNDDEQANHRRYFEMCNNPFGNPELYQALWQEVALRAFHHYGAMYMRFSMPLQKARTLQVKTGLSLIKSALLDRSAPFPSQQDYLLWYHMVVCESHRQMLATALGVLGGEIRDVRTEESRCLADEMMPWSRGVMPETPAF